MPTLTKIDGVLERVMVMSAPGTIDRDACIIRHVKIVGTASRNGRRYPQEVLEAAVPLYEGCPVYLDHPPANRSESRQLNDYFGTLINVEAGPDGLFGDLLYRQTDDVETILEAAQKNAANFGLSHNALVRYADSKNTVVAEIIRVRSVDLVDNPATTRSLFESEEDIMDKAQIEALENELATLKQEKMAREVMESCKLTDNELLGVLCELKTKEAMEKLAKVLSKKEVKPTSVALEEIEVVDDSPVITSVKDFLRAVQG